MTLIDFLFASILGSAFLTTIGFAIIICGMIVQSATVKLAGLLLVLLLIFCAFVLTIILAVVAFL